MTTMQQTYDAVRSLRGIIAPAQLSVMGDGCRGEEAEYFKGRLVALAETFATMPKTYEQDGKGDNAVAYLHYFYGEYDWYITEKDMEAEQHQAFGLADMGHPELGYISLIELASNGVELDLHWSPKTIGEIKKDLRERHG